MWLAQLLTQPGTSASVRWGSSGQGAGVWAQGSAWYPEVLSTQEEQVLGFGSLNTKKDEQTCFCNCTQSIRWTGGSQNW